MTPLQLSGDQVQPLGGADELVLLVGGGELNDLVARQHELTHEVHEVVEQADVDPDRAVRDARLARPALGGQRLDDVDRVDVRLADEDLTDPPWVAELLLVGRERDLFRGGRTALDQDSPIRGGSAGSAGCGVRGCAAAGSAPGSWRALSVAISAE